MRNPDLPRRQLASKTVRCETVAGQKRAREEQLALLDRADAAGDSNELQAVADEAASARRGKAHDNLCKTLQKNAQAYLVRTGMFSMLVQCCSRCPCLRSSQQRS